jgi:hypothetical protein
MNIRKALNTFLICFLGITFAQVAVGQPSKVQGPSVQVSSAKKIPLVISCGEPKRGSISQRQGIWTFVLNHGDVGKCPTDANAKNASGGIPYMERAEVSGHKRILPKNKRLLVSAMLQADPRGSHVYNSIIFQVHQWDDKRCNCGAPIMLSFYRNGHLQARLLRETHRHNHFTIKVANITPFTRY